MEHSNNQTFKQSNLQQLTANQFLNGDLNLLLAAGWLATAIVALIGPAACRVMISKLLMEKTPVLQIWRSGYPVFSILAGSSLLLQLVLPHVHFNCELQDQTEGTAAGFDQLSQ